MQQDEKLKKIIQDYPDVWMDYKKFKALLLDFYPQDKITRNLLLISVEEKIPEEVKQQRTCSILEKKAFAKRIVSACNCSMDDAERIITLWLAVYNVFEKSIKNEKLRFIDRNTLIDDLEIPSRCWAVLKRSGVSTVQDLIDNRHRLFRMRNMGRKSFGDISRKVWELGYDTVQYSYLPLKYEVDEKLSTLNSVRFYDYLTLAQNFQNQNNLKMTVLTLEKAVLDGFKGDYSPVILAYKVGSSGIEPDSDKVFFLSNKWNEDYKANRLVDLPEPGSRILIWYALMVSLMDGYGEYNDEDRKKEILTCVDNIIRTSYEIDEADNTELLLLGAIGIAYCEGRFHFPDTNEYPIEKDVEKAFEVLDIVSTKGAYLGTKGLIYLFFDEEFKKVDCGRNQGAYELLFDLYFRGWKQNKDDIAELWNDSIFSQLEDAKEILISNLELPVELKNKLIQKGIQTYKDFNNKDVVNSFKQFDLSEEELIQIIVALSQFLEENDIA